MSSDLAAALREINEAFSQLSPRQQGDCRIVADDVLDAALLDGSPATAMVDHWRRRQLAAIREVGR